MFEYFLFFLQIALLGYLIFVLLKKKDKSLRDLIAFNFSIIIWVLSILLITRIQALSLSIIFARLTFSATALAVCTYASFFNTYTKYPSKVISRILNIFGVIMAVLAITPYLITSMSVTEGSSYPAVVFGNLTIIYVSFVVLSVIYLIYQVVYLRRTSRGLEYLQVSYITIGMTLAGIIAILTNVILPAITGDSASAFWGPVAVTILSTITTYSVTRRRLFGIRYILGKIIYYIILTSIPFLLFVLFINILPILGLDFLNPYAYLVGFVCSFLFILLFSTLSRPLDQKFNPAIGFKSVTFEEIKDSFLKDISTELDIERLGITTLKVIDKIFDIKRSGVVIFNTENSNVIYKRLHEFGNELLDTRNLLQVIQYWEEVGHSTVLTKDELSNSKITNPRLSRILSFMKNDDIDVVFPLNRKVHLNGVVFLGSKNSKNPFTIEDIHYLENLIMNSSVAFSRSILYRQVEDLNQTLQQKVNEQTKELQIKVQQLQEARRKERDMIDIMGHELRTPATVVKLNAELLEKFTDDVVNNKEKFEEYLKRIKTAVDNEIKLINTLLSSAKLEGDKIELNPEEINILEDIEMAVHGHEVIAQEKGLELINNSDPNTPNIYADHARVIEILNNLIDNAIKYTDVGSVSVSTSHSEEMVSISVHDTGKGIPEDELPKLGQKFYRVENYLDSDEGKPDLVRPGGTGLGLYVAFSLVEKMGGKMEVTSEIGRGSVFTFTLPRMNGQMTPNTKRQESKDMFERLGLRR